MSYCKLNDEDGKHRCEVCGATFAGRVRAVCGVERKAKRHDSTNGGAGTELKRLLRLIGITASSNCSCNAKALTMDARGTQWCAENIETIVQWLKEEAAKRGLPFLNTVGRLLVKRAIHNARKATSG